MNIVLTIKKNVKMKKTLHFWLMALLIGGISMAVTSCKDDDKNNNGGNGTGDGEEQVVSPTQTPEADMAAQWLVNLTYMEEFTDDWASKTYEPNVGEPSKNNSQVRVVCVPDLDYAKMLFSNYTGIDVSLLSSTQTQTIEGIGSMTWTPSPEGAENLAVVDVNTKLIPHLSRIVYCTKEQMGDNGGYKGTAYFRFGDVLCDNEGYYWVCVMPPFGSGEGAQQQGFWINVINRDPENGKGLDGRVPPIPDGMIEKKYNNEYNGNTILVPVGRHCDKTQVFYLSNLLWAVLDPDGYEKITGGKGTGLGGYEYQYNGAKFAKRVAQQWTEHHIWEKLFNRTYDQMKQFKNLNFYYWGYSFWPKVGSKSEFWLQSTQKFARTSGKKSADLVEYEMKEPGKGFDIRRYCSDPDQNPKTSSNGTGKNGYAPATQFSSTDGYWYVRTKTSSDLEHSWSHPSVYVNIKNMAEIYRYNATYNKIAGNTSPVETEADIAAAIDHDKVAVGNLLGQDGHFYATAKDAKGMGTEPVAIVAWLAGKDTVDLKKEGYNGLCIALKRMDAKSKWINKLSKDSCDLYVLKNYTNEPKCYNGYAMSMEMLRCDGHDHPAGYAAITNTALSSEDNKFSKWFLPSIGQFVKAIESLGGFTWSTTNGFGTTSQKESKMTQLRKKFEQAGVETEFDVLVREEPRFWTTTLIDERNSSKEWTKACTFKFQYFLSSGEDLKTYAADVTSDYYVLPFIAFKYENK